MVGHGQLRETLFIVRVDGRLREPAPSVDVENGGNMFTLNKVSIESIYDGYVAYCERVGCKPASYATWKLLTKS